MNFFNDLLNRHTTIIQSADNKGVIIITGLGIMLTLVYSNARACMSVLQESVVIYWISIFAFILFFITLISSLITILPRISSIYKETKSYFFFGDILNEFERNKIEFRKELLHKMDDENQVKNDLLIQIVNTSSILVKKFYWLRISTISMMLLCGLLAIILIIYFLGSTT